MILPWVETLRQTELTYCRNTLKIPQGNPIHYFFADSGQQAINVPLMVFGHQYKISDDDNGSIHLFKQPYFEVSAFLKDNKKDKTPGMAKNLSAAKVVLVDSSQSSGFKVDDFANMKICIIDLTHDPLMLDSDLSPLVKVLLAKKITLVLASSMLKHEQLGLDKYQAGKFFVITPPNRGLAKDTVDSFSGVSQAAANPYSALAFNLFNDIGAVKTSTASPSLARQGLFAPHKQKSAPQNETTYEPRPHPG